MLISMKMFFYSLIYNIYVTRQVQNKRTNYQIYLVNILKESGRIISYIFINLILIVFIEKITLIKLLMVQLSMSVS